MSPTPKPPRHLKPVPSLPPEPKEQRQKDRRGWKPGRRDAHADIYAAPDKRKIPDRRKEYVTKPKPGAKQEDIDWLHQALGLAIDGARKKAYGKPRLVPKPDEKGKKLDSSSGPFQEYGDPGDHPGDFLNRDRHAKAYADYIDAENERKDAEWAKSPAGRRERARQAQGEKDKLDQDVRESPSAEAFLGKMRDKAKEQQDAPPKEQKGRPGFKSPLPPYHTPPTPGVGTPRRSEGRNEYDIQPDKKKGSEDSRAITKGPDRKPIPPYKPTAKPPPGVIPPRRKPGVRTDVRAIDPGEKKRLPPRDKPTGRTPPMRPLPGVRGPMTTTAKRR